MASVYGAKQQTLGGSATLSGITLHTGDRVNLSIHPADSGNGIVFRRTDLPGKPEVQAHIANVTGTRRATTICQGAATVHTVEHLMATFNALGVDNALVEMNGPEPPLADGSAVAFVEMVRKTGVKPQKALREWIELSQPIVIDQGETKLIALPADDFQVSCTVKYGASQLDCQYLSLKITQESFIEELSKARTFCLFEEIEPLMAANLIRGGSLDNSVIIKGQCILSKEGLRYPDEMVRHKILDTVGDLFLLGKRLKAQLIAIKPGHPSNVALAQRIYQMMEGKTS
jgi:UDP-3-O-[3-hydroxymyristoyl] N-acetylglucosamine deacetylase/3-hydroxyacyl-[acyl-carrier-protein] dehydratase